MCPCNCFQTGPGACSKVNPPFNGALVHNGTILGSDQPAWKEKDTLFMQCDNGSQLVDTVGHSLEEVLQFTCMHNSTWSPQPQQYSCASECMYDMTCTAFLNLSLPFSQKWTVAHPLEFLMALFSLLTLLILGQLPPILVMQGMLCVEWLWSCASGMVHGHKNQHAQVMLK